MPEQPSRNVYESAPQRVLSRVVARVLEQQGVELGPRERQEIEYIVAESPRPELGDYGIPAARYAKRYGIDLDIFFKKATALLQQEPVVAEAKRVGGYLNITIDVGYAAKLVFEAVRAEGFEYGRVKTEKPERIVVEHTSANPVHPLHIGHARNASLGDSLARLLRARGHVVQTRFYINDMGRQVAVLAYGYIAAGLDKPPKDVKPDHWIGLVYAITHTLSDIEELKKRLEQLKQEEKYEEYRQLLRELDELVATASRLRERDPELFERIAEALKGKDPSQEISKLMQVYEYRQDPEKVELVRKVVQLCLQGFRETLSRLGIEIEKWDWESELAWTSMVSKILEQARSSPYATVHKGALALNLQPLLRDPVVRERLGLPEDYEIPPLILQRSDGTTLYTTRDIAYSIKKFREFNADRVFNVIAAEQRLEQLQVRLALIALGYRREGLNMIHYAYEMVNLPGQKMSGRRGRYITLDELIDQAVAIARQEVEKRSPGLPEEEKQKIAEAVGTAAVRYTLVSVSAPKPMTFNINEALNFERNSAPYILYTHARAASILAKARERGIQLDWDRIDYSAANENMLRRSLVIQALVYPYVFAKAADEQRPELIVAYLNRLADIFNRWYTSGDSVVNEQDQGKQMFKLALVYAVKQILANALDLLGIKAIDRM
ncbi:Arginyl-tRNA synthetase [Pyrodictium delaneyi]|uniref:Arginine--tRNA ligase n=1 Tax=Pyrodictium delaneyi TaxID=1273541 RepID=A0A0P0N4M0_9CREN|nr:arginine--tRNA ligase [Pyrodictium delaneyi]ALL01198.1 Arginyl-tRNA synthetase [Pyrodictium delaneyi]OWJ55723.1 arginine--tRNA ligase [Pyrodictium delaneyi]